MGWPKGKPRKKSSDPQVRLGERRQVAPDSPSKDSKLSPVDVAGPRKRDPAKRALSEIQKVLLKLEKARAHVADLEQQVARMSQSLAGAVQSTPMPTQLKELMSLTKEPEGPSVDLSPADTLGPGRFV